MTYKVAIIGSFQKYYNDVLKVIKLFHENGLWVLSPKVSKIAGKIDDSVIFESDNTLYSPEEIEMVTLEKILDSEAVYVYNPKGYVDKTTCYEIGFCISRSIPLYFYTKPDGLPIPIQTQQILIPEAFVKTFVSGKCKFIEHYDLCDSAKKAFNNIMGISFNAISPATKNKNVVICGSMSFYKQMLECKIELQKFGINCIVPKNENELINILNEKEFCSFKQRVSNAYLRKIRDKNTTAVLIYNGTKNGVKNYIGTSTLIELATALSWNKKIYLFDEFYEPISEELLAWNCIPLHRNLNKLTNSLNLYEESGSKSVSK